MFKIELMANYDGGTTDSEQSNEEDFERKIEEKV